MAREAPRSPARRATAVLRALPSQPDVELLKKFGLRWAVLAAWRDALRLRHVVVGPETDRMLETARMKLASGCFNVCEVGCDLQAVEAALTTTDSSTDHN